MESGGHLVPEDPAIKSDNLSHILEDAAPSVLIVDRAVAERLDAVGKALSKVKVVYVKDRTFALSGLDHLQVQSLDAVLESTVEAKVARIPHGSPDNIASITYTSGTTGRPKGVMHTHEEAWLAGAFFTKEYHARNRSRHHCHSAAAASWPGFPADTNVCAGRRADPPGR